MTSRFILMAVTIGFLGAAIVPARAEGDPAALAAAMKNATATLQGGLKASEAQGTPISAKFEIEDGRVIADQLEREPSVLCRAGDVDGEAALVELGLQDTRQAVFIFDDQKAQR